LKRVISVLTVLFVIWLGFTLYFITKHSVVGKEAKINKTVEFDDVSIHLNSLVLYNFERKAPILDTNETEKFKYKLLSALPKSLVMPYWRIMYLYSSPYEIDNKRYTTALFGKCEFTHHINDSTEYNESEKYNEYFEDHISINVVDSMGAGYSSGGSRLYEDNSHELGFSVRGRDLPIERIQTGMKVIIKHLDSEEEREFVINSEDFIKYRHNDSFRKKFPFQLRL